MNEKPEPAPGVLYIVGTPIGNMGDLSPRAKSILQKVSVIACEDTRYSGQLLKGLKAIGKRYSFHKHNTTKRLPLLVGLLKDGDSLALISDAGLPGINDPGEELVKAAKDEGIEVICIPGPCAAITALVSSGITSKRFCFEGFLPTKSKERKLRLSAIANEPRTTVLYEAPHRLLQLLEELLEFCGSDRPLQVAKELTKKHEQQIGPTIETALTHFHANKPKGEFTLVLGGATLSISKEENETELKAELEKLITKGASAQEATKQISKISGQSKRFLYSLLHKKV